MAKTREDWVRHFEELKKQGRELEGLVRVPAQVAKDPQTSYTTVYTGEEIKLIYAAAKQQGIPASTFIRNAALAAAAGELDLAAAEKASLLAEMRLKLRDLSEAMDRLYAATASVSASSSTSAGRGRSISERKDVKRKISVSR